MAPVTLRALVAPQTPNFCREQVACQQVLDFLLFSTNYSEQSPLHVKKENQISSKTALVVDQCLHHV
jgi:hypothetical protein